MSIVRPRAMKTTISASPASEPWKRSISVLYGIDASPRKSPATKTARKPEPPASDVTEYRTAASTATNTG